MQITAIMRPITYLLVAVLCTSVTANAQNWRLYNMNVYDISSGLYSTIDSALYTYNYQTDRTSTYNNDSIAYDTYNHHKYYKYLGGLTHVEKWERVYNADNRIDYEVQYILDYQMQFVVGRTDSFEYNSNGQVTKHVAYRRVDTTSRHTFALMPYIEEEYHYDNNNLLIQKDSITIINTAEYANKRIYTYNAAGYLVKDSMSMRLQGGTWRNDNTTMYSYDGMNRVVLSEVYTYLLHDPAYYSKEHKFIYTGSRLTSDTLIEYKRQGGVNSRLLQVYTYNGGNALQTHYYYLDYNPSGSGYANRSFVKRYTYTSFGYVDSIISFNSYGSSPSDTTAHKHFYEHHFPVSTATVVQQQNELIAYPVPSSNFINLKWQTDKPTHINARIVNLQGQVVKQWSDDVEDTYIKSIYVGELPAGNYIVIFEGGGELLRKEVTILH